MNLQELSAQAKLHYEAREYMLAQNLLVSARTLFDAGTGKRFDQGNDGSIVLSTLNAQGDVEKQEPV